MNENEILNSLLEVFSAKLRPVIYEIVNDVLSKHNLPQTEITTEDENLWTIKEVTKYFGCSKATIFLWQKKGLIKSYKIGNKVFYKKKELNKSLKNR